MVAWKQLKIPLSYTIEASFCGSAGEHFTPQSLQGVGAAFCEALRRMLDPELRRETAKQAEAGIPVEEIDP